MASGDTLLTLYPTDNRAPAWLWVAFTSGSTQPSLGDTIWGDTSNANVVLEYEALLTGSWAGNDAAGWFLFSNHNGTAFTSGENFTANTTTAGDHGTLTGTPADAFATPDTANHVDVLDFGSSDTGPNEVALFKCFMPRHYAGGGLTCTFGISSTTATGDMSWFIFLKSITDDVDNLTNVGTDPSGLKVFAAPNTNTAFDAASVAGRVAIDTITFSDGVDMDSIAAGEMFFLLLLRDADDATNDDMAADAEFQFMEIQET